VACRGIRVGGRWGVLAWRDALRRVRNKGGCDRSCRGARPCAPTVMNTARRKGASLDKAVESVERVLRLVAVDQQAGALSVGLPPGPV